MHFLADKQSNKGLIMSNIIVAIIVVASVTFVCLLLAGIHNKQKRKAMNELLNYFRQAGTENNFSFSSEEVLQNSVLGLDPVHRKLLFAVRSGSLFHSSVIDVNNLGSCTVKKHYGTIQAGDLKKHKLEQYLDRITLHLEPAGKPPVEIDFYRHSDNHLFEIPELEQKARYWETFLAKMQKPLKKTG